MSSRKPFMAVLVLLLFSLVACSAPGAKSNPEEESGEMTDVVGYLGDEAITQQEIEEIVGGQLRELEQKRYDLQRRAVEQVALKRLLEKRAEEAGMTLEEFLTQEISAKTEPVTDEMITQIYEQNKNRDQNMIGKSLDQVRGYIQQGLSQQLMARTRDEYFNGLLADASVRVMLEPPRAEVPIPDYEPTRGPAAAPVTIVEFADYECGYCRRIQPDLTRILDDYGDKVRFVYRDYPLSFHPKAEPAAIAARCAGDQGKYWDYHIDLMSNVNAKNLEREDLVNRATKLQLDMAAFTACIDESRHQEKVRAGFADGQSLGVTGTPTLFINGRMLVGAASYDQMKSLIDDELARAGVPTDQPTGG